MEPLSWYDCFVWMNGLAGRGRFSWPQPGSGGFNCHPDFTISDLTGGAAWLITAPGDWVLGLPAVSSFLELDTPVVGHVLSWWLGMLLLMPLLSVMIVLIAAPFVYAAEDRRNLRERERRPPLR
jgi:hypothetical protein